ncbi:MAG: GrpB family protein [Lachnospiraceae bacterium]|nr:GrpB family protein [Lachnospiraceae bacterium]
MKTKHVIVEPYNEIWPKEFEKIKAEIEPALANLCLGFEHIGSTSVIGLSSKPIIDIDVVIENYFVFPEVIKKLNSIGYIHEGDLGIKDREAFKYADKPHLLQHHLYVCPKDSKELQRHITFRDFLRSHPESIKEYSKIKEEAAKLYPDSIEKYMEYKSPCIAKLYTLCGLDV